MPDKPPTQSIAVTTDLSCLQDQATELARELALPLTNPSDPRFACLLVKTPQRLELRAPGSTSGPVYIDFTSGALAYRRRFGGGHRQPLAKAVGLKGGNHPTVLDPTAGLGRDAFVLACLGCTVRLVERSPIIAALLRDGLHRAAADPEIGTLIMQRLSLSVAEGCAYMKQLSETERPDVVYLDPMYPHRTKTAMVKKELRVLRYIVGEDHDAPALLTSALICARRRVVVKRPRLAPRLEGPPPGMAIEGKNTRFDVYLITVP